MKKIAFIICLTIASLACGMQALPPSQLGSVNTPSHDVQIPVKALASAEPTDAAPIYITTAPLNVRAEANADSTILGTLETGTVVTVFVLDIRGDDCYMGEWYAIEKPIAGFVCSLYIEEK